MLNRLRVHPRTKIGLPGLPIRIEHTGVLSCPSAQGDGMLPRPRPPTGPESADSGGDVRYQVLCRRHHRNGNLGPGPGD